jgi:hypothetical protein
MLRDMTLIVKLITNKSKISKMILRPYVIKKLKNNAPNRLWEKRKKPANTSPNSKHA